MENGREEKKRRGRHGESEIRIISGRTKPVSFPSFFVSAFHAAGNPSTCCVRHPIPRLSKHRAFLFQLIDNQVSSTTSLMHVHALFDDSRFPRWRGGKGERETSIERSRGNLDSNTGTIGQVSRGMFIR